MCGICGIYLLDPEAIPSPELVQRMNQSLIHRGPDDEGYFFSGSVGMGMRRLSIIDLAGGRQPIANEDGSIHIVFNGEIYNYSDLRDYLISKGHVFRTASDTEVIVHLFEEKGSACVEYLNGMFAFALWNEKDQSLFLARDRLGIKPLFYSFSPGRNLIFGSEIKALLCAGVDRTPDHQAMYDYLSLMYVPTPATAFASIRKLPPGSSLTCSRAGITIRQYWDIPLPDAGTEDTVRGDVDEEILSLLQAAVARHMIADVPVGAFLSGGLDSTTVVAIMGKRLGIPVKTYTIGFKERSYDESSVARLVAETLGTDHQEKIVEPNMIDSIPDLLGSFDEPFADYSCIPTYLVSRSASKDLKVVLTGDGGDEVFAGYPTHYAYRVTRLFRLIPKWVRHNFINPLVMCLPASMDRISFDYMAKRFVTGADLPFQRGHYWWKVIFNEDEKSALCTQDFLGGGFRDTFQVFDAYFQKARKAHPLNQLLYVDAKTFLLDDNLVKVDRMTMANSLEARVPLLDHELVERIAMIDPDLKSRRFETKRLLRRAAKTLLPSQIQKGKKKGFTPPLPYWIGNQLRPLFEEYFEDRRLLDTGILDPVYCRRILDEHLQGVRDNNRQLWTILSLMCWLEKQSEPSTRST